VGIAARHVRFAPVRLPESRLLRLQRLYPGSVVKHAAGIILVRRPTTARIGGQPIRDRELLAWVREVVEAVLLEGGAPQAGPTDDRAGTA
jgi:transcription-repair coupling factor (superfamily II helicase)